MIIHQFPAFAKHFLVFNPFLSYACPASRDRRRLTTRSAARAQSSSGTDRRIPRRRPPRRQHHAQHHRNGMQAGGVAHQLGREHAALQLLHHDDHAQRP